MLSEEISRRRFDVDEYHRMLEVGLLTENDRVELIEGEIVEMNPIGVAHMSAVNLLTQILVPLASRRGLMVSVQNPVRLDRGSEPEPDLALIAAGPRTELPSPADTSLVIEVSDTTLEYDRNVKLPLYAGAGIGEVWILDLPAKKVEVYSGPEGNTYREKRTFGAGESVVSATLEGLSVPVEEVLA
ncbi:Putative restriction endonuclease [Rubrobacter radiotolerans]|uniref:Putative restriction endonuclease n=1 Tax=Rubrobacter radiotolerans TaxID=42256 RepID=A0A023X2A3_RUBRA|nr:Uma2 family endonuclease [Rubrobacter radiotolerans]AHY46194.1 Putative restriction endonuclease [Rubrobacter radiotolerans]MDX5893603.1 Uma2 family endonuclease [Rubrobacter radiotolerans]SMC04098.1 Endonuclease, Uma2 family (restriction endonuclease fold) [Rubrobacter radiotolerans DSM 5868]